MEAWKVCLKNPHLVKHNASWFLKSPSASGVSTGANLGGRTESFLKEAVPSAEGKCKPKRWGQNNLECFTPTIYMTYMFTTTCWAAVIPPLPIMKEERTPWKPEHGGCKMRRKERKEKAGNKIMREAKKSRIQHMRKVLKRRKKREWKVGKGNGQLWNKGREELHRKWKKDGQRLWTLKESEILEGKQKRLWLQGKIQLFE